MMTARMGLLVLLARVVLAQAAGDLLVATPKSHDPELGKSVVLLIHSGSDGTIGLILNRPVKDIYFGGPVALGVRSLIRSREKPKQAEHVFADVWVASGAVAGARVYAGYVGWSAQQLHDEVALGLWKVLPGNARVVFDPKPGTLWTRLFR
jgi:putative transcriptional regulator